MHRFVQKEFKWQMAHKLVGWDKNKKKPVPYPYNCKNNHGHSYRATIKIGLSSGCDLDCYGMVYDYNKMKKMKDWIDENLDHSTIVSSYDKAFLKALKREKSKYFLLDVPTTAENIAQLLFNKATEIFDLDGSRWIAEVKVYETDSSEATYGVD